MICPEMISWKAKVESNGDVAECSRHDVQSSNGECPVSHRLVESLADGTSKTAGATMR